MKTPLTLLLCAACLTPLAAQDRERPERAERPQRPDPAQFFANADTNEDGYLDLSEFTAFRDNMPGQRGPRGPRGPRGESAENDTPPAPQAEGQRGRGGRGGRGMPSAEDMFALLDKNEDGKIAPDEFNLGNRRGRGGPGGGEGRRARTPK